MYAIERKIADLSSDEKYQARQTLAVPILSEFKPWLERNLPVNWHRYGSIPLAA
ncbi:MAG: hypothetical protein VXW48_09425 [Pseudomonadota bacterium]|nr:hypothetical protein [Pseudomonadota bacterium]